MIRHLLVFAAWCLFVLLCWPVAMLAQFLSRLLPFSPLKH